MELAHDRLVLSGQHLTQADFSGQRLVEFSAQGSRLDECSFNGTVIKSASFGAGRTGSEYVGCTFDDAKLSMTPGGIARFEGCTFLNTRIDHWFCFSVEMVDCTFTGRLTKAIFNGSVPADRQSIVGRRSNQFEGNDFERAELIDVAFRTGIDLTKQRLPSGDEYAFIDDAAAAVSRARVAYSTWTNAEVQKWAGALLKGWEEDVANGQAQLLVRPDDHPPAAGTAIRLLIDAARTS